MKHTAGLTLTETSVIFENGQQVRLQSKDMITTTILTIPIILLIAILIHVINIIINIIPIFLIIIILGTLICCLIMKQPSSSGGKAVK